MGLQRAALRQLERHVLAHKPQVQRPLFQGQHLAAIPRRAVGQISSPPLVSRQTTRKYATTTVAAADLDFGQPVYETHSHMLEPGESPLP
jgi:intermediate cleaving peptidase 55